LGWESIRLKAVLQTSFLIFRGIHFLKSYRNERFTTTTIRGKKMKGMRMAVWAFLLICILSAITVPFGYSKNKKLPDLQVSALTGSTSAKIGKTLQSVSVEVQNQGKRPAGAFRVKFYLSADANFDAGDFATESVCEFTELPRGEVASCNLNIPLSEELTPGQYFLIAYVDEQNVITETVENNNVRAFGPITIEKEKVEDPPPPPPDGSIHVDGDPEDWAGIAPLYTDALGDGPFDATGKYLAGNDIVHISVTNDNHDVYFLIEFAGAPFRGGLILSLDTDVNPVTGCTGYEAVMFSSPTEPSRLLFGDYGNCEFTESFPNVITSAVQEKDGHSYLEASIRKEDLFRLTQGREDFRFFTRSGIEGLPDDVRPPTVYSLTSHFEDGANLQIAFDSENSFPDFSNPCGTDVPGWHYGMRLMESAGVGLTITSFKTVIYDLGGGYLQTIGSNNSNDFARLFDGCGTGSDYIPPHGEACSRKLCLNLGSRNGAQLDITFTGMDDKGHPVRFTSGRLILHSR
jgi:hypothetical protein